MKRTYPIYLTIFIFSLCHQLSHCESEYSNYTFTAMGDYTKEIPPVCWLTLHCPGARIGHEMDCIDMDGNSDECTLEVSKLGLNDNMTFCSGSSTVTIDHTIAVATEEENSAINIISRGTTLMCSPIVSCNVMDVSIMWSVPPTYNEHALNDTSLSVEAKEYGNYTCTVTAGIGETNLRYELYGGPRFADRNEHTRVTLNDRVEFTCNPDSHPPLFNISWLKDGDEPPALNFLPKSNETTIVFEEADYDDEGVYTCVVCNKYNCNSKNFQLKVRSPLTPLWPAIGIILELSLVGIIIMGHEWYKKRQQKKDNTKTYNPTFDELRKQDDDEDAEAYNFPAHSINYSEKERQRIGSITQENLLPASVQ